MERYTDTIRVIKPNEEIRIDVMITDVNIDSNGKVTYMIEPVFDYEGEAWKVESDYCDRYII